MQLPGFNRATHFSIVWAVTLAVLTTVEWRALDRDPVGQELFLPFIEREITVLVDKPTGPGLSPSERVQMTNIEDLRYEVDIDFNGLLFLLCFCGPIVIFHLIGRLGSLAQRKD